MITIEELTVEIARQRDVLRRIESLVWYEPDDDDDLVEAVRAMARERDEARAEGVRLRDDLAQAQELVRLARMITTRVQNERDEARAEIERLRGERDK